MTTPSPALDLPVSPPGPVPPAERECGDLATGLFTLLRAIRARQLLDASDPRARSAFDDAQRALAALSERSGSLSFRIEAGGLRDAADGELMRRDPAPLIAALCRAEGLPVLSLDAADPGPALAVLVERLAVGTGAASDAPGETTRSEAVADRLPDGNSATLPCHEPSDPAAALAHDSADEAIRNDPAVTPCPLPDPETPVQAQPSNESEDSLETLIERASGNDPQRGITASQVLLRRGTEVVPELLARVVAERDERRRGHLCGVLIVMGERATPVLVDAIRTGEAGRARIAAWIAGEIQDPGAVPALAAALHSDDATLRREAARALAKVSQPAAIAALDSLFDRGDDESASLAAWCLAAASGARPLSLLRERLNAALHHPDFNRAREIVHALARRASPDAVQDLAAIFDLRSLLHRRALRELKIAAVRALAKIPGEATDRALRDAAEQRDSAVREAALTLLARRSGSARAA